MEKIATIKDIKRKFKDYNKKKNEFNIFKALHNEDDERRLHSRFISYLLSPESSHGMRDCFLKLFINRVLKIDDNPKRGPKLDFELDWDRIIVLPNEKKKAEFYDIDILIDDGTNAVVIENKIFAGDSNHTGKNNGYNGQLSRYYNTIKEGKDEKNDIKINGGNFGKRESVFIVYLTLSGKEPSKESYEETLKIENIKRIDYPTNINGWLSECRKEVQKKNELLSKIIAQYQILTSDIGTIKNVQELLSEGIDIAWELQSENGYFTTPENTELFKHVQWHTIADFFNELETKLNANVQNKPKPEDITKVVYAQSDNTPLSISFRYNGIDDIFYIANDNKGFTFAPINGREKYQKLCEVEINFNRFSDEATFKMINSGNRAKIIAEIAEQISKRYDKLPNAF